MLIFSGCAQLGVPSGGDPDKDPPVVIRMYPENESVNFSDSKIQIAFNEYVVLNDINNQLIISPPLEEKPEISLKKKTLSIEFQEELRENTTYTINFGEGIKDYNVGNVMRNFTLAFSTGPVLDSLSISGKVIDAATALPKEKVKVMLYSSLADSVPKTSKPSYFAQTDASGGFKINYLSEGEYKLFALEEVDGDFMFNNEDENIAFRKDPLRVGGNGTDTDSLRLFLFNEELDLGYVTKVISDSLAMQKVAYNAPQKDVHVFQNVGDERKDLLFYMSEKKDTLVCFLLDQSEFYIHRNDQRFENSEILIDTLQSEVFMTSVIPISEHNAVLSTSSEKKVIENQPFSFKLSKPISDVDQDLLDVFKSDSLRIDSLEISMTGAFSFDINGNFNAGETYKFVFLPNSVSSTYGNLQDTARFSFSIPEAKNLGELIFKLNIPFETPVLMLKKSNGMLVESKTVDQSRDIIFSKLFPSEIEVYCLDDKNKDGAWTTGNYGLGIQPEQIVKFPNKIEVRANWSQEFAWE